MGAGGGGRGGKEEGGLLRPYGGLLDSGSLDIALCVTLVNL